MHFSPVFFEFEGVLQSWNIQTFLPFFTTRMIKISQVFIALNQGMIVVLIGEGSKVRDRPTGDLSLYYWEHLKYIF